MKGTRRSSKGKLKAKHMRKVSVDEELIDTEDFDESDTQEETGQVIEPTKKVDSKLQSYNVRI